MSDSNLKHIAPILAEILIELERRTASVDDKSRYDAISNEDALGLYLSLQAERKSLLAERRRISDEAEDIRRQLGRIERRLTEIRDEIGSIALSHPDD